LFGAGDLVRVPSIAGIGSATGACGPEERDARGQVVDGQLETAHLISGIDCACRGAASAALLVATDEFAGVSGLYG
jgi:hypothetical protein